MSWLSRLLGRGEGSHANIAGMQITPGRLADMRASDQYIVSFPRSGNTWTRHLVHEVILQRRPDLAPPGDLDVLLPTLHKDAPDHPAMAEFGLKSRILKSHNIRELSGRRMVYVFREAADSLVSFFHHRRRSAEKRGVPFEETIDAFCKQIAPAWCEHVRLGTEQASRCADRTLMLAYETLHSDTAKSLRAVVDFLDLGATDEQIVQAVERASFGQLRAKEEQKTEGEKSSFFFRKGQVGSAKDELMPPTLEFLRKETGELYERALKHSHRRPE